MESPKLSVNKYGSSRFNWNPLVLEVYKEQFARTVSEGSDGRMRVVYASKIGDAIAELERAEGEVQLGVAVRIFTRAWRCTLLRVCVECNGWFAHNPKRGRAIRCVRCARGWKERRRKRRENPLTQAGAMLAIIEHLQRHPQADVIMLMDVAQRSATTVRRYVVNLEHAGLVQRNGRGVMLKAAHVTPAAAA